MSRLKLVFAVFASLLLTGCSLTINVHEKPKETLYQTTNGVLPNKDSYRTVYTNFLLDTEMSNTQPCYPKDNLILKTK